MLCVVSRNVFKLALLPLIYNMNFDEQTDAFTFELDSLVDRYIREFDINLYTIVGVLEGKQWELLERGTNIEFLPDEEDEEDEDPLDFLSDLNP
jgi:hypothetical protein